MVAPALSRNAATDVTVPGPTALQAMTHRQSRLAGSSSRQADSSSRQADLPPPSHRRMRLEVEEDGVPLAAALPSPTAPKELPPPRPPSRAAAVSPDPPAVTFKAPPSLPDVKVSRACLKTPTAALKPPPLGPLITTAGLKRASSSNLGSSRSVRFDTDPKTRKPTSSTSIPLVADNDMLPQSSSSARGSSLHILRRSTGGTAADMMTGTNRHPGGVSMPDISSSCSGVPYLEMHLTAPQRVRPPPSSFAELDELSAEYNPLQGPAQPRSDEMAEVWPPPQLPDPRYSQGGGQSPDPDPDPGMRAGPGGQGWVDRPLRMAGTTAVWYENLQQILHPASFTPAAYESVRRKDVKHQPQSSRQEGGGAMDDEEGGAAALDLGVHRFKPTLPFKPRIGGPSPASPQLQQEGDYNNAELLRRAAEGLTGHQGAYSGRMSMRRAGSQGGPRGIRLQPAQPRPASMSMPGLGYLPSLTDEEALCAQHPAGAPVAGAPYAWPEVAARPGSVSLMTADKLGRSGRAAGSSSGGFLAFLGLDGTGGRQGRRWAADGSNRGSSAADADAAEPGRARKAKKPRLGSVHPTTVAWSEGTEGGRGGCREGVGLGFSADGST